MLGPSGILGVWSSEASVVSSTQAEQSLLVVTFGVLLDNTHTFKKISHLVSGLSDGVLSESTTRSNVLPRQEGMKLFVFEVKNIILTFCFVVG